MSICSDVWTKQGMTASFLGVTVHCFTYSDKKRHNITLAVRRFEQPHTGQRIAELLRRIVDEWKIPHFKIFHCLTDNGSNMIKAFKILASDDETNVEDSDESSESIDQFCNPELEDKSRNDDDLEVDGISSDEDDDTNFDLASTAASDEIREFEDHEDDHNTALGWKRCSCLSHTLQLVVKEFEKTPCFKKTPHNTYKIVKKSEQVL